MSNSVCTLCCDGCKEHGERVERERILALLKESHLICQDNFTCYACDEWQSYNQNNYSFCKELIALIKGEPNE